MGKFVAASAMIKTPSMLTKKTVCLKQRELLILIKLTGRYLDVVSFNCYDFDRKCGYRCLCGRREAVPDFRILLPR